MATNDMTPNVILMNGRIATQDERRSFAQAVAIQDGRFSPSVGAMKRSWLFAVRRPKSSISAAGR